MNAFYSDEIEVTPAVAGTISPYHTASGLHAVQALIGHAMGDVTSVQTATRAFAAAASGPCENLDLTLGRSSVLLSASTLLEALAGAPSADRAAVTATGGAALREVWNKLDSYSPISEAAEIRYTGIAHGWAGILYASLRWCRTSGAPLPAGIGERLQQLAERAEETGRGARWKWSIGGRVSKDSYMSGWCNGSSGFVHLWTLAHRTFGDARHLALAQKSAWNVHESRGAGASLCCGDAGRAYALLNLYRHTGEPEWLQRAKDLTERGAREALESATGDNRYALSLYKGQWGLALLAEELAKPERACMPFFEEEGWPSA